MDFELLQNALSRFKNEYENAVRTATFNDKVYENGERARMALIRSSRLILYVHEVGKISICGKIEEIDRNYVVHPPLGQRNPELKISGFIKTKAQDLTFIFDVKWNDVWCEGPAEILFSGNFNLEPIKK